MFRRFAGLEESFPQDFLFCVSGEETTNEA